MHSKTDAELVEGTVKGDRAAFAALVDRHRSSACGVAYAICGNFASSEDIAQEAFLVAWQDVETLREQDRFGPWVCGIARKLALNFIRRQGRQGHFSIESTEIEPVSDMPSPLEEAFSAEEKQLLWSALERLDLIYREPLVLFYREQQSIAAVSIALDLSEATVKQRLSRGRIQLREEIVRMIEGVLVSTRPGNWFTQAVLAALPPAVVFGGLSLGAGSAKAASAGSGVMKAGSAIGLTGATLATSVGAGTGLLGLYLTFRLARESTIDPHYKRFLIRLAFSRALLVISVGAALTLAVSQKLQLDAFTGSGRRWAVAVIALAYFCLSGGLHWIAEQTRRRLQASSTVPLIQNPTTVARRHVSPRSFLGLPWICVAIGSLPGEPVGRATGWIAIGDSAKAGFLAAGGVAVGPIAIGRTVLGIVSIGGYGAGVVSLGGLVAGGYACGALALGVSLALGSLAVGWSAAVGALAVAKNAAVGMLAYSDAASADVAWRTIRADLVTATALDHVTALGWVSLVGIPGIIFGLLALRKKKR